MKTALLTTSILFSFFFVQAQNTDDKKLSVITGTFSNSEPSDNILYPTSDLDKSFFEPNCTTDFYSVKSTGEIQKWSLANGTITGGDTVLTNSGDGIAYCGDALSPTFYSTSYPNTGITYYDAVNGWVDYPSTVGFSNIGGHEYTIFLHGLVGGQNKLIYHFDGVNFTLLEDLTIAPEYLNVADIAVDNLGQAWIFKGTDQSIANSLNVYDETGFLTSYSIDFNSNFAYGTFFLDGTLYIAFGNAANPIYSDEIVPVILSGSTATLGTPIAFIYDDYVDMASCQIASQTADLSETITSNFSVYPNPSNGSINFDFGGTVSFESLVIYDNTGRIVHQLKDQNDLSHYAIDLNTQSSGIYHYTIQLTDQVITGNVSLK